MSAASIAESIPVKGSWHGSISPTETQELVAKAKLGDTKAFAVLYREYVGPVHRFVASRVRDSLRAEDIVAEVFVRALKSLPRYEFRGVEFSAWLFRIARNLILDHARSSTNNVEVLRPETPEATEADHSEATIESLDHKVIIAALLEMIPEHRTVLELRFVSGLPVADVAKRMGKTEGAIRVLQFRALKAMKRFLDCNHPTLGKVQV